MPNRYTLVNGGDVNTLANQINQNFKKLDAEVTTKQFKDNNGNQLIIGQTSDQTLGMQASKNGVIAMQVGKYNATRYGQLFYDSNGVPIILIGQAPDDGRMGIWQVKPGQNVLTQLGG